MADDVNHREGAAFEDYWALGPQRSIPNLHRFYEGRVAEGKTVPTLSAGTLRKWAKENDWDGKVAGRQVHILEHSEAAVAGERQRMMERRLKEASALHVTGAHILREIIDRVQNGELKDIPLFGYWEVMTAESKTEEDDYTRGPNGDLTFTGKGKRKSNITSKIVKVLGLMDVGQTVIRMIETGQKLERLETGVGEDHMTKLVMTLVAALPPEVRDEVQAALKAEMERMAE